MSRDLHANLNVIGPYLSHTLIRTRIKGEFRTLITSAQRHPWVRGSVATLFSQYTLLISFYCKIVATEKQLLTPVLRFSERQATKSGSTFSPRVCDVQPPCHSHAHLFERDNFHRTTGGSPTVSLTKGGQVQSVSRGREGGGRRWGGGGKLDIEKRLDRWQK